MRLALALTLAVTLTGCATLKTQAVHGQSERQAALDQRECKTGALAIPMTYWNNPHAITAPNLQVASYVSCLIARGYETEVPVTVSKLGVGYIVPQLSMKVRALGSTTEAETNTAITTCAAEARAAHALVGEELGQQAASHFGLGLVNTNLSEDERAFITCMARRGYAAK